jgi:hypothetical protein
LQRPANSKTMKCTRHGKNRVRVTNKQTNKTKKKNKKKQKKKKKKHIIISIVMINE